MLSNRQKLVVYEMWYTYCRFSFWHPPCLVSIDGTNNVYFVFNPVTTTSLGNCYTWQCPSQQTLPTFSYNERSKTLKRFKRNKFCISAKRMKYVLCISHSLLVGNECSSHPRIKVHQAFELTEARLKTSWSSLCIYNLIFQ